MEKRQTILHRLSASLDSAISAAVLGSVILICRIIRAILDKVSFSQIFDGSTDLVGAVIAAVILLAMHNRLVNRYNIIYTDKEEMREELEKCKENNEKYKNEVNRSSPLLAWEMAKEKWNEDDNKSANDILYIFLNNIRNDFANIVVEIARYEISQVIEDDLKDSATHMNKAANMLQVAEGIAPDADETRSLRLQYNTFNEKLREQSLIETWENREEFSMADKLATLQSATWLIRILSESDRKQEALEIAQEGWERGKISLSPDHETTLILGGWLTELLHFAGKKEEALVIGRYVWAARKKVLPAGHEDIQNSGNWLVQILFELGKRDEAEIVAREVWEMKEASSPSAEPKSRRTKLQ